MNPHHILPLQIISKRLKKGNTTMHVLSAVWNLKRITKFILLAPALKWKEATREYECEYHFTLPETFPKEPTSTSCYSNFSFKLLSSQIQIYVSVIYFILLRYLTFTGTFTYRTVFWLNSDLYIWINSLLQQKFIYL